MISRITPAQRATVASTVGTALEWIDFTAYGAVAATVFPKIFFSSLDPNMGILAAFVTFGVGFFARPLGGVFFGTLGDVIGRKTVLLYTLGLMGVSSFLMGCLPTYSAIGIYAPACLVLLRFLQGFALGGEATGAQLITMEHAPADRRGLYGAFVNTGSSISAASANGVMFVLVWFLGGGAFEAWGWRVPFLASLILVFVGLYIRRNVEESPAFEHAKSTASQDRAPIIEAFRDYHGTILRLLLAWCGAASCFYIINVFTLSYITRSLALSSDTAFLCLMGANLLAALMVISGGALSDRIGRRRAMLLSLSLMLCAALSYFALLDTKNWLLIFFAMASFVGTLQMQSGIQPAFFAESFPARVRYSGSAAAYTGANLIAAAPTPFIAAWLLQRSGGSTLSITIFCAAVIVISLIATFLSPETKDLDIRR